MVTRAGPRVLLTGGAGYIGSHTAKYLAGHGIEPVVVDNLRTGYRSAVKWGPLVECDLADAAKVQQVLQDYSIDCVIHFAAHCYVGESVRHPAEYFGNNIVNTLNLLNSMRGAGVRNIVFSSSCATYGDLAKGPISEDTPQLPANPYGESKLFVERALKWYGQAYGLRWVALRYFNAAGADPEGELGERHDPETHLIPLAIDAALGNIRELEIYGTDYPTPDGSAVRDYVHVNDLAAGHFRALEYLQAGGESGAFNLGAGAGYSVTQVVRAVEVAGGRPVPVKLTGRRPGDPPTLVADARRAREALGWTPQFSSLENIVATAYRWRQNHQGERPRMDGAAEVVPENV